jgi:hypothetical protein
VLQSGDDDSEDDDDNDEEDDDQDDDQDEGEEETPMRRERRTERAFDAVASQFPRVQWLGLDLADGGRGSCWSLDQIALPALVLHRAGDTTDVVVRCDAESDALAPAREGGSASARLARGLRRLLESKGLPQG